MPGYDRTGPAGASPKTGWGRGLCGRIAGRGTGYVGEFFRGVGRGGAPSGGGRGRCFGGRGGWLGRAVGSDPSLSPEQEAQTLKAELQAARTEIADLEARLAELEKSE